MICLFISVGSIFILFQFSSFVNHRPNGFIRLFPPHFVTGQQVRDMGSDAWYIAGLTGSHVFLANYKNTGRIMKINLPGLDSQSYPLRVENRNAEIKNIPKISIDSPYIFIQEGSTPISWTGTLDQHEVSQDAPDDTRYFNFARISPDVTILSLYDEKLRKTILAKYNMKTHSKQFATQALSKQLDGIFCTDGMIQYNPTYHRLIYAYFYRNEFISLDTNLNIMYRGKTLDTNSFIKFTVSSILSQAETKISSPPIFVTKKMCLSGPFIYIQSGLLANNEEKDVFESSSVIDVFNIENGSYIYSFHLPNFKNIKMRDFKVKDHILIALYDQYIFNYTLKY